MSMLSWKVISFNLHSLTFSIKIVDGKIKHFIQSVSLSTPSSNTIVVFDHHPRVINLTTLRSTPDHDDETNWHDKHHQNIYYSISKWLSPLNICKELLRKANEEEKWRRQIYQLKTKIIKGVVNIKVFEKFFFQLKNYSLVHRWRKWL